MIEQIRSRELQTFTDFVNTAVIEHCKRHFAGNNTYSLDNFQDPDFQIMPAFGGTFDSWDDFIDKEQRKESLDEIEARAEAIKNLVSKKRRYGTTKVIVH